MKYFVWISIFVVSACAGTPSATITSYDADKVASGIRYYEPAPFLLVYSDANGHLESEILILPDTTHLRVVDPYSIMASNNSILTFENGMLTGNKSVIDETAVAKQSLSTLKEAATAIAASAFDAPGSTPSMEAPHLYRIILSAGEIRLVGGAGVDENGDKVRIDLKKTADADDGAK